MSYIYEEREREKETERRRVKGREREREREKWEEGRNIQWLWLKQSGGDVRQENFEIGRKSNDEDFGRVRIRKRVQTTTPMKETTSKVTVRYKRDRDSRRLGEGGSTPTGARPYLPLSL